MSSKYLRRSPEEVANRFPETKDDLASIYEVLREIAMQLAHANDALESIKRLRA